jgi:glycosyltransferase involved in cell wall biosynthesis
LEPVSVIIPTFNRAHLVPRAVASALACLKPEDELIVVDDGSMDDTAGALAPFQDRIQYVRTENRGAGAARNRGLSEARSPLIAFLDSDDEWMSDSLRIKRAVMQARPDLVFCFTDFAMRDERGGAHHNYLVHWHHDTRSWNDILRSRVPFSSLHELGSGRPDFPVHFGDMYPLLLQRPYVPAWTSLVRRELAGNDFHFAEDLRTAEDWACFGQIARRGTAAFLDCETAWNHGHSGPRLTSAAGMIGYLNAHLQLAQRIWGADMAFLKQNAQLYDEVIASIRLQRARWYLSRGRKAEARADLESVATVPRSLRLLAGLPAPLLALVGAARRTALSLVNRVR